VPRPKPYPKNVLDHLRWPALYQAVDEVADALGAPPPDAILLRADFNASYGRAGWRRRHVLTLGLPLLTVLDEQETAALIAHELAHAVNGDATRGFLIGSAATTLSRWYYLLLPDQFSGLNRRRYGLGGMLANTLMFGMAQVVRAAASVMSHLVWHDSQRAEYLADHLAAEVAGTTATVALLEKVHMGGMFQDVVRRATLQPEGANLFADLRDTMASLPERERERLRRVTRLEGTRLDATHPPTGFRVALLEARPFAQPRMVLSALRSRAVHQELARAEPGAQRLLIDQYRAALYH
jgi:Zn-dependent protease with chaperone function